jgi:hypothetical protein
MFRLSKLKSEKSRWSNILANQRKTKMVTVRCQIRGQQFLITRESVVATHAAPGNDRAATHAVSVMDLAGALTTAN